MHIDQDKPALFYFLAVDARTHSPAFATRAKIAARLQRAH